MVSIRSISDKAPAERASMKKETLIKVYLMAWNALVENREGENLTNAIESSDIGNKTLCLQAFCLQKNFSWI